MTAALTVTVAPCHDDQGDRWFWAVDTGQPLSDERGRRDTRRQAWAAAMRAGTRAINKGEQ